MRIGRFEIKWYKTAIEVGIQRWVHGTYLDIGPLSIAWLAKNVK